MLVTKQVKSNYYQRNKEKWKQYRKQGAFNLTKRKEWSKAYNKQYRETNRDYFRKYDREHWRKYYYGNLEKQREQHRLSAERYSRRLGRRPQSELVGENHPSWRGGPKLCVDCRVPVKNRSAATKRCFSCNRRWLSGSRNPMWTGGHTSFRKSLYATKQYKEWRRKVFERDDFTCQICFVRGGELEAHHKKRMIVIIKEFIPNPSKLKGYQVRDLLLEHEPLWDVSNGITLCQPCHRKESRHDKQIVREALERSNL